MNDLIKNTDLEHRLLTSENSSEIQSIIDIFNTNIKKKDVLRAAKISDLQDKITDEIDERISRKGGEFSNRDLLDYYKALQTSLDNTVYGGKDLSIPSIQINSNTINVDSSLKVLNRESRQRIFDTIHSLLNSTTDSIIETSNEEEDNILESSRD